MLGGDQRDTPPWKNIPSGSGGFGNFLGLAGRKKKSQGGHRLRSQRWREHLEGRLMAEMLFTTSLNVD